MPSPNASRSTGSNEPQMTRTVSLRSSPRTAPTGSTRGHGEPCPQGPPRLALGPPRQGLRVQAQGREARPSDQGRPGTPAVRDQPRRAPVLVTTWIHGEGYRITGTMSTCGLCGATLGTWTKGEDPPTDPLSCSGCGTSFTE